MTTSTTTTSTPITSTPGPTPIGHRALGWAAAAGAVPYLTLKTLWLSGQPIGITDAALITSAPMVALNAVTLAMDLVVIALALALTHSWGDRLPAWLVLLPMWVGTGFLVPMAVSILPATVLTIATGGAGGGGTMEPWVQPLVYGGFAWQGIFLGGAFAWHASRRWAPAIRVPSAPSRALAPLVRVITAGGVTMAALSAGLHVAYGFSSGDAVTAGVQTITGSLALAGAAGVVHLVSGRAAHRLLATTNAWVGTSAMFSWGLYAVATTMADTPLASAHPLGGPAQLTGLLGGFALAVAGLLALAGTGVARPGLSPARR